MFVYLDTSKMQYIIYSPDFHNLQSRNKSEMVQTTQIKLSIIAMLQGLKYKLMLTLLDISEICSMIQRFNSYNSLTDKVPWTIYRSDKKKQKEYRRVENELSINDNIKTLKYKSCLSFRTCQKKIIEFTDSTHMIYWPTSMAKKAANYWNRSFYICQY